ncbi:MAG: hypothetical protein ACK6DA_02925 [Candidatus Kapaibacterium sp.]|jgi:hypothetical protein
MAIAYDAGSESHTGTTGSTNQSSFTWTHTPVGTPKGVLVFTFVNANADDATSVSYGSSSLTTVGGWRAVDTGGEPGDCKAWFLGSSVPTGAQTVTVNRNNNANEMYAVAITVTSSQNSDVHTAGIVLLQNDGAIASQSVTDGSSGTGNSVRFAAINCGADDFGTTLPSSPAFNTLYPDSANSTWIHGIDFGTRVCGVVRETTAGTGARSVGFFGPTDDRAAVHLAIKDVVGGAVTTIKDLIGSLGIIPFRR